MTENMNMNLESYVITEVPPKVHYIPNFITPEEEENILNKVNSSPKPKWTQLRNRRLQNWGGVPHPNGMISEKIPEWLEFYMDKINKLAVYNQSNRPNHVLVNEYLPGQGIMPHTDGPLFHPIVTTITCGSHTVIEFYERHSTEDFTKDQGCTTSELGLPKPCATLLLERQSLLILQEDMYHRHLHGISEQTQDTIDETIKNLHLCQAKVGDELKRSTRISLTIRNAPKSTKIKLFS
nr:PREDICTED: alpha-ketoglutarate-dependent dioxygenase alkB homolog 6 [Bemisia tabaci]